MLSKHALASVAWAKRWMARQDWVVLDTETTGLDRNGADEVIEVALLAPNGSVLYQSLIQTQDPKRSGLKTTLHGISRSLLDKEGKPFPEVWADLIIHLEGKPPILAYGSDFDRALLEATAQRYHLAFPPCPWECVLSAYARYHGEWNDWYGDWKFQSLNTACRCLGIPRGMGIHRAVKDASDTLAVLRALAEAEKKEG